MRRVGVGDFRISKEEKRVVMEVMESGRISEGEKVREFEEKFAEYIGVRGAVLVNSGTSALIAGLLAMIYKGDIEEGSGVVTTPLTYIATSNAIKIAGLNPLYVDVDKKTFGITPEAIEDCIEEEGDWISAILLVHLMGYACDMKQIKRIADEYDLKVLEDAAQAHGSMFGGKKLGSFGDLSIFSFYIAHNIQAGEMGAVVSDDYELLKLVKQIKANGRECSCPVCRRAEGKCPQKNALNDPRFNHMFVGFNFKSMEFQAALGLLQLGRIKENNKKRRENVTYLNEGLMNCRDVLQLPLDYAEVSHLAYPLILKTDEVVRQKVLRRLEEKGVEARPLFGCIPTQQPAYEELKERYKGRLPNAEWLGRQGFYVGCHQYLEREDLDYMVKVIKEVLEK